MFLKKVRFLFISSNFETLWGKREMNYFLWALSLLNEKFSKYYKWPFRFVLIRLLFDSNMKFDYEEHSHGEEVENIFPWKAEKRMEEKKDLFLDLIVCLIFLISRRFFQDSRSRDVRDSPPKRWAERKSQKNNISRNWYKFHWN